MFLLVGLIGVATMGIIAFGPVLSVILNHAALSAAVVGAIGVGALLAVAVPRLKLGISKAAREEALSVPTRVRVRSVELRAA